jgi:thiamine kinase-like enzyme
MESQGFFTASGFSLSRPDVFFASTREEKVQIIARLNCHAFIDDLWEVFAAADFPAHTQRILFGQPVPSSISVDFGSSSWREISHYLLGDETEVDIRGWLEHVWQRPPVDVGRMSGRGNSRIFRATDGRRAYALKLYPDPAFDVRDRLGTEAAACRFLEQEGVPSVSRLAHAEQSLNLALFDWIEGDAIRGIADTDLQQALNFVSRLQQLTQVAGAESLPQAAEACLSVEQLVRQITARERRLSQVAAGFPQLSEFLAEDFGPLFAQVRQWLKDQEPQRNLDRLLPRSLQTLSPSDFGFHNALRRSDGSLCWLDFEYFGWDDPVKLVADFLWHPAMQLTAAQQQFWVCSAVRMFQRDPDFQGRLRYCWPLYGLRWCLILLNEFLHDEWRKRSAADAGIQGRKPEKLDEQLRKAQQVLATLERYHFECPISP